METRVNRRVAESVIGHKGLTKEAGNEGLKMLTQEMLNEIQVGPGEQRERPKHKLMSCPACHEAYLGDGAVMCIDCEIERKETVECQVKEASGSEGE